MDNRLKHLTAGWVGVIVATDPASGLVQVHQVGNPDRALWYDRAEFGPVDQDQDAAGVPAAARADGLLHESCRDGWMPPMLGILDGNLPAIELTPDGYLHPSCRPGWVPPRLVKA